MTENAKHYKPSEAEEYMNDHQIAYFKDKLQKWKDSGQIYLLGLAGRNCFGNYHLAHGTDVHQGVRRTRVAD